MLCFYLAKQGGVGYQNRLKAIWDTRNPSKVSVSINTLCCHARNILTAHMLSEHELMNIETSCTTEDVSFGVDSPSVVSAEKDSLNAFTESDLLTTPSESAGNPTPVDVSCDGMFEFPRDELSQCLEHNFCEVHVHGPAAGCLLQFIPTKATLDRVTNLNDCLKRVLVHSSPSLRQSMHLLYAAAIIVCTMLPRSSARQSNNSWKSHLEDKISNLRQNSSCLFAGGFPPTGSQKLLHKLRYLHSKYHIRSSFEVSTVVESLKQSITSCATRLRKYKVRLLRLWQNKLFRQNDKKWNAVKE